MRGWIEQHLVLVLSVQVDERRGELAQNRRRSEGAINECATAPSLRRNFAPDDHFRPVGLLEDRLDGCGIFARSHEVARRAAARQESDRADEDGFAGPGFSREHTQARLELELEPIDDGKIADAEEP